MQFELPLAPGLQPQLEEFLPVAGRPRRLALVKNPRARRYLLRVRSDGVVRVTIPRGGSAAEARRFAARNTGWIEKQLLQLATNPPGPKPWLLGTKILFRGIPTELQPGQNGDLGKVRLGTELVRVRAPAGDLRPDVERHLWRLAARELPPRVRELAAQHQLPLLRVSVRNQRSRWGSCSRRGTVSLNWRLIQAPDFVRDYIVLHELAHFIEMNHSRRFWRQVARLCPEFSQAEAWLKAHARLLR